MTEIGGIEHNLSYVIALTVERKKISEEVLFSPYSNNKEAQNELIYFDINIKLTSKKHCRHAINRRP